MTDVQTINYQGGKAAVVANNLYQTLQDEKALPANQSVPEWLQGHVLEATKQTGDLSADESSRFLDFIVEKLSKNHVGGILVELTKDPKYVNTGSCPVCTPDAVTTEQAGIAQTIADKGYIAQVVILNSEGAHSDSYIIGISRASEKVAQYLDILAAVGAAAHPSKTARREINRATNREDIQYPLQGRINTIFSTEVTVGNHTYSIGLGQKERIRSKGPEQPNSPVDAILIYLNPNAHKPGMRDDGATRGG